MLWREWYVFCVLTPKSTTLLVHIYIGIHSTFFGRISMRTDRERERDTFLTDSQSVIPQTVWNTQYDTLDDT